MVDENVAKSFWVDMDQQKNVTMNELLSNSHRRAAVCSFFLKRLIRLFTLRLDKPVSGVYWFSVNKLVKFLKFIEVLIILNWSII